MSALSDGDLETLARLDRRRRKFRPGHDMIHEGQANASAFILADGWACSYKLLPEGRGRSSISRSPAISSACAASCCAPPTTASRP
jgi:CRP-like cAMP-binding protein